MEQKIKKTLVKFFMNAANINDLETLTKWLKKDEHKQVFKSYIKTNYAMDINTNQFDTEKAKKEYLNKIRRDKKVMHKFKIHKVLKYAAAAVIVFSMGFFFQQKIIKTPVDNTPIIVNNIIEPGIDKATLTLADGSNVTLKKGQLYEVNNISSNGKKITYKARDKNPKEIVYNYLTIPRGGQFQITLSDGTKVWLNSESKLKYPVTFIDGETRQVELVYGEAYFDVTSSTKNKGTKFKVFNQSQEIEVLGTEFNIKAYKDESNIYTTLVEGKVSLNISSGSEILIPNQQSNLNIINNTISIVNVDVYDETSWRGGLFSFKSKSLKEIMTVLSRWYNMDVTFAEKRLEKVIFTGVLGKEQDIEEILMTIKNFGIMKSYEINNEELILK